MCLSMEAPTSWRMPSLATLAWILSQGRQWTSWPLIWATAQMLDRASSTDRIHHNIDTAGKLFSAQCEEEEVLTLCSAEGFASSVSCYGNPYKITLDRSGSSIILFFLCPLKQIRYKCCPPSLMASANATSIITV